MATTIRDVARHAGVSIATVSRALRDAESVTVETRARVARAAADLDYVPSQLGRQLAERRHAANGIVFPDLSGPYYAEVVLGYEVAAAELDHAVLILSTHGRDDAEATVTRLAARTDGLVVVARTVSDALVQRLVGRGTPVVVTVEVTTGYGEDAGLRVAADAVTGAGLPDAFACANDELALGLWLGLRQAGVTVPDDTLISGWDDVMAARHAGLTTVRQPMRELGARAALRLHELISGTRQESVHDVLATDLIVRSSTTPPGGTSP
jgi:LacI family transcriptional regulator